MKNPVVIWREGVEIKQVACACQVASKFPGDATLPGFQLPPLLFFFFRDVVNSFQALHM